MILGYDFIISSSIWLIAIGTFVYTVKKVIIPKLYPKATLDLFLSKLKIFLEKTYPDIKFDFSIVGQSKSIEDPNERKLTIADNIFSQYKDLKLDSNKFPKTTSQSLQWSSYVFNCEPNKDKLPPDWVKRKNALIIRDHKKCLRCSKNITIDTINIYMLRSLKEHGKYNLENLISICKDCEKILTNNTKKQINLNIKESLNAIVQEV
jgi:hypothetical protein